MSPTNRLPLARRRVGLSVGQAAKNLRISAAEIIELENKETVSDAVATMLAEFYGVTEDWLRGVAPLHEAHEPLDIECPTCGVQPRKPCLGTKGPREPHPAQVDPTHRDRVAQDKANYSRRYYSEKLKPRRRRATTG